MQSDKAYIQQPPFQVDNLSENLVNTTAGHEN